MALEERADGLTAVVSLANGRTGSRDVAMDIRDFLNRRPDYNYQLRLKILQAADPVFRAERLNP